ncbi:MAG: ribosome silencing factor [Candidatus Neomarinimicrobiota bacterium]|nr:ribosome silencing factor [Candidatus Neomarinimicrobiota bacterium]
MPTKRNNNKLTLRHAKQVAELMLEKKALNVKIIDVRKITTLTDFFIICTSESQPQTRAIADHIQQSMKKKDIYVWHVEGYEYLDWVLLDFINIVVHVFNTETREYYSLERLWADGKIISITDTK